MKLKITKGARQFGYLIWSSKTEAEMEKMLQKKDEIKVSLNSFDLGEKHIDRKYHRISLGYKFTRALPENHDTYNISLKNDCLEVTTTHGTK